MMSSTKASEGAIETCGEPECNAGGPRDVVLNTTSGYISLYGHVWVC